MGKVVCMQKTVELGQRESKDHEEEGRGSAATKYDPKRRREDKCDEPPGEGHRWNTPGRFKRNLGKKENNLQMNRKLQKKVTIIK